MTKEELAYQADKFEIQAEVYLYKQDKYENGPDTRLYICMEEVKQRGETNRLYPIPSSLLT